VTPPAARSLPSWRLDGREGVELAGQYVPLLVASGLAGIGLLILGLSGLVLFKGPTDWIYAMTGRLTVAPPTRAGGSTDAERPTLNSPRRGWLRARS